MLYVGIFLDGLEVILRALIEQELTNKTGPKKHPKAMRPQDRARIPIVLGVVGHRDIHPEAKEKLTEKLHEIFEEFDTAFPNSPKVLLSPLAPGADQLAAKVALYYMGQRKGKYGQIERHNRRKNWSVRAPLSFPPDDLLNSTSFTKLQQGGSILADDTAQKTFKDFQDEHDNAVEWFMLPMPDEVPLQWELDPEKEWQHGIALKHEDEKECIWSITLDNPNLIIIQDKVEIAMEINTIEGTQSGFAERLAEGHWAITLANSDPNSLPNRLAIQVDHQAIKKVQRGVATTKDNKIWSVTTEGSSSIKNLDWNDILRTKSDSNPEAAALRSAFYAHPGGYIVRHCHTLIALWDDKHIRLPSGTNESVRFQLGGLPLTQYPLASAEPLGFDSDRGPAILLYTPRADDPTGKRKNASKEEIEKAGEITVRIPCGSDDQYGLHYGRPMDYRCLAERSTTTARLKKLWSRIKLAWGEDKHHSPEYDPIESPPLQSSPEYDQFLAICQAIEDYNTDVLKISKHDKKYLERLADVEADLNTLFPKDDPLRPAYVPNIQIGHPGSSAPINPDLREWFHRLSVVRETAAHISGTLSKKADSAPVALMTGLLAVIAILHSYAHPPWHLDQHEHPTHHRALLDLFYLGWGLLATFICYVWYRRLDERRIDYRALAEALRTRQAWAASGLAGSVADSFVPQVRSELIWIRRALQHVCPPPSFWKLQFDQLPSTRKLERFMWVKDNWVLKQKNFHKEENHLLHEKGIFMRRVAFLCFLSGLAILALPYLLPGHDKATSVSKHVEPEDPTHVANNRSKTENHSEGLHSPTETTKDTASKTSDSGHQQTLWGYFGTDEHPALFLLFAGGLLIGTGGIIVAIVEKLGLEIRARSHEQAYSVFRGGSRELETTLNPRLLQLFRDKRPDTRATKINEMLDPVDIDDRNIEHAQKIIEALGREAALESALWLMLRRSKALELPLGG